MIMKLWWKLKLFFRPACERRTTPRPSKVSEADALLKTAILDLTEALKTKK